MRDLTRSLFRFSWAMSMLGARQAANLVTPRSGWDRSVETFDAISRAAAEQMGETLRGFYKAGDRFQDGMLDTASRLGETSWSNPGQAMNETWEALDRTFAGVRHGAVEPGEDSGEP